MPPSCPPTNIFKCAAKYIFSKVPLNRLPDWPPHCIGGLATTGAAFRFPLVDTAFSWELVLAKATGPAVPQIQWNSFFPNRKDMNRVRKLRVGSMVSMVGAAAESLLTVDSNGALTCWLGKVGFDRVIRGPRILRWPGPDVRRREAVMSSYCELRVEQTSPVQDSEDGDFEHSWSYHGRSPAPKDTMMMGIKYWHRNDDVIHGFMTKMANSWLVRRGHAKQLWCVWSGKALQGRCRQPGGDEDQDGSEEKGGWWWLITIGYVDDDQLKMFSQEKVTRPIWDLPCITSGLLRQPVFLRSAHRTHLFSYTFLRC